jgi:hypothetical protein
MNYAVESPELIFLYASASTSGSGKPELQFVEWRQSKPELQFVKNTTIIVLTWCNTTSEQQF